MVIDGEVSPLVRGQVEMMSDQTRLVFPRTVLLIEIDRRCSFADCNARIFVGLTKPEALAFRGFECEACGRWNDDRLRESDVPEWWREIAEGKLQ